jgi:hypothetical protein
VAQIGNGMPQVPLLRPGSDAGATAKPQTRLYGSKILPQSRVDPRLIPLLLRLKPRNAIRIQPQCSNSGPPESVICPGAASPRETPRSNPQSERYVPQPIPKNPNSLQQGTNTHNSTQLQLLHRKRLTTNPITPIPTYPNLFHVEQAGHPSSSGRRESSQKKLNQGPADVASNYPCSAHTGVRAGRRAPRRHSPVIQCTAVKGHEFEKAAAQMWRKCTANCP